MKTVFDEMTGEDPSWLVYKLKSHQLSLQELAALGRRVEAVWPSFRSDEGMLLSGGDVIVYTPMRLRSFLVPIVFLTARRLVAPAIDAFYFRHCCEVRKITVKHRFFLPRVYTQPLKPISDFGDTINGVKLELELTGAFKRENRFWSAIKRVLNVG